MMSARFLDGLNVLVVDDDEDARVLLSATLGQYGAKVATASTVRDATPAEWPCSAGNLRSEMAPKAAAISHSPARSRSATGSGSWATTCSLGSPVRSRIRTPTPV